jgi:hypothetical protein
MVDIENTRFKLTLYMLAGVLIIVIIVMLLSAINIAIPEFVSGVVVMGFMTMLSKAYDSYFKAREELQATQLKIEEKKLVGCGEPT